MELKTEPPLPWIFPMAILRWRRYHVVPSVDLEHVFSVIPVLSDSLSWSGALGGAARNPLRRLLRWRSQ